MNSDAERPSPERLGRAEKGRADWVCSGVVMGITPGRTAEGEDETPGP